MRLQSDTTEETEHAHTQTCHHVATRSTAVTMSESNKGPGPLGESGKLSIMRACGVSQGSKNGTGINDVFRVIMHNI